MHFLAEQPVARLGVDDVFQLHSHLRIGTRAKCVGKRAQETTCQRRRGCLEVGRALPCKGAKGAGVSRLPHSQHVSHARTALVQPLYNRTRTSVYSSRHQV